LTALSGAQGRRIDIPNTNGLSDRVHGSSHGVQEGGAGVFHEMPPVGDLNSFRSAVSGGLLVAGTTIARDDGDRRAFCQPPGDRGGLAIGQNVNDTPPLQVADNRPVPMTTLPGPVIYPDHPWFRGWLFGMAPDRPKQGVFTHGKEKATREALPWSAAQCEAEMMDQPVQSRRPSGERADYRRIKTLHEYPLTAIGYETAEPARLDLDPNRLSLRRQVRKCALIPTLDIVRPLPARRTGG
jgi:hypothetical protein